MALWAKVADTSSPARRAYPRHDSAALGVAVLHLALPNAAVLNLCSVYGEKNMREDDMWDPHVILN